MNEAYCAIRSTSTAMSSRGRPPWESTAASSTFGRDGVGPGAAQVAISSASRRSSMCESPRLSITPSV